MLEPGSEAGVCEQITRCSAKAHICGMSPPLLAQQRLDRRPWCSIPGPHRRRLAVLIKNAECQGKVGVLLRGLAPRLSDHARGVAANIAQHGTAVQKCGVTSSAMQEDQIVRPRYISAVLHIPSAPALAPHATKAVAKLEKGVCSF